MASLLGLATALPPFRVDAPPADGDLGLMVAVGPGMTCETALLRWRATPVS